MKYTIELTKPSREASKGRPPLKVGGESLHIEIEANGFIQAQDIADEILHGGWRIENVSLKLP